MKLWQNRMISASERPLGSKPVRASDSGPVRPDVFCSIGCDLHVVGAGYRGVRARRPTGSSGVAWHTATLRLMDDLSFADRIARAPKATADAGLDALLL